VPTEKLAVAGDLMFEIDSLYVSTEIILSHQFRQPPLDGLLLEVCLVHFRVVWDFFYPPKKAFNTDVSVLDFIPKWDETAPPTQPARLKRIRDWVNVMVAHLTVHRVDPAYQAGEITSKDIEMIREHTRTLFTSFWAVLTAEQRKEFVNPLAKKFAAYDTLNRLGR
jgi:hypothetical protein